MESLGDDKFAVTVKGTTFKFRRLLSGHLKLLGPVPAGSLADSDYARDIVGLYVRGNVRGDA